MLTFRILMMRDAARKEQFVLRAVPDALTHRLLAGIEVGKRGQMRCSTLPLEAA
jgi:hypothetical protein